MGIADEEWVPDEQPIELRDFLDRANRPWNPIQVAGRHSMRSYATTQTFLHWPTSMTSMTWPT